jgi:hypothetical protein
MSEWHTAAGGVTDWCAVNIDHGFLDRAAHGDEDHCSFLITRRPLRTVIVAAGGRVMRARSAVLAALVGGPFSGQISSGPVSDTDRAYAGRATIFGALTG